MDRPLTSRGARKRKPRKRKAKKGAGKGTTKGRWKRIPFLPPSKRALLAAAVVTTVGALGIVAWFVKEYTSRPGSAPYRPIVQRWASEYGVDPDMVAAVLECESSGRARAVSESGALGLMQLMPKTAAGMAKELGLAEPAKRDLFDPELNIRLGSYYLAKLRKRFGGDRVLVIAAYHAGPTRIADSLKRRGNPPGEELLPDIDAPATRAYVSKVMRRWQSLTVDRAEK